MTYHNSTPVLVPHRARVAASNILTAFLLLGFALLGLFVAAMVGGK